MEPQKVQLTVPVNYAHCCLFFFGLLLTGTFIGAPIGIPMMIYALWINKQYRKQKEEKYERERQRRMSLEWKTLNDWVEEIEKL